MKLDSGEYNLKEYVAHIVDNSETILQDRARNELKAYLFLTNKAWEEFFPNMSCSRLGEVAELEVPSIDQGRDPIETYHSFQYSENVALVFTFATMEHYQATIQKILNKERGVGEVWIRPSLCGKIRGLILERYPEAQIRYFVAKRTPQDLAPAEFRPDEKRRISYSGQDGREVLGEVEHLYGVHPTSIFFDVASDMKLKVYEDGLIILQTFNQETFDLMFEIWDMVIESIQETTLAAFSMRSDLKSIEMEGGSIVVPEIFSGEIHLPRNRLDAGIAESFSKESRGFSFLDLAIEEGSLVFSATVIDEDKESVFGLSASEDSIRLIPRYNTTFETFLRFYRYVAESIDDEAFLIAGSG
ncbi:MAG: hypothetical protein V3U09_07690 [Thermoplasmata archaeon]